MKVVGVILCGGKSTRMGVDKASLSFAGNTLIDRSRALLEGLAADYTLLDIVTSGRADQSAGVIDLYSGRGPLGGIHAVMRNVLERFGDSSPVYLLIVPVDMPCLRLEDLKKLLALCDGQRAVVHYSQSVLPLAVKAGKDILNKIEAMLENSQEPGKASVKGFIGSTREKQAVKCEREVSLFNVNTPEDLKRALSFYQEELSYENSNEPFKNPL
ncbi:MAG: molybdenum cofactor guanylyltransferase [Candidatus Dadabacteria bacterium]|nr:MAG: molybdenum cofactor guanylyltransferase [Candidatus Dadabacteria bacterium]